MKIDLLTFKCQLFEFMAQNSDLQTVLNYAASVFEIPVHITDAAYKLLAFSDNMTNPDPLWEELKLQGYFSEDTIRKFYTSHLTSDIASQTESVFFESLGYPYIITPIFMNGNKVASVTALISNDINFTELSMYMAALADFIKNKFCIDNFQIVYQNSRIELFLKDLLNGQIGSPLIIQERSHYFGFQKEDVYALLNINTASGSLGFPALYFKNMVKNIFPDAASVIYGESIVVLFHFADVKSYHSICLDPVSEYITRYNMHCCLSSPFKELTSMQAVYQQTCRAIAIGCHLQPDQNIFYYSDLALYHLLETAAASIDLTSLCHPSVILLYEYDQTHDSDYVNTLYELLLHQKKQTVQQKLFIHRNTLNYRIEKIESLIHIDWENTDELCAMLLSCKILQYVGKQ